MQHELYAQVFSETIQKKFTSDMDVKLLRSELRS